MHGLVPVSYTVVPRHTATTVQGGASAVTLSDAVGNALVVPGPWCVAVSVQCEGR